MRRRLITIARPTALLLVLIYLLGAVPAYCTQCFTPAGAMQAPPDNQTTVTAAARCQCNFQVSGVHHSFSTTVNTAKAYPQPTPFTGPIVAMLDVNGPTVTWSSVANSPQFRSPSRVLNYGVRLE